MLRCLLLRIFIGSILLAVLLFSSPHFPLSSLLIERLLSVDGAMFASAVQMSSPDRSSAFVSVIVGWVGYLCLKIPSGPLV